MKKLIQLHQKEIILLIGYLLVGTLSFNLGLAKQRLSNQNVPTQISVEQAFAPLNNSVNSGLNQSGGADNLPKDGGETKPSVTDTKPGASQDCAAGQIKGNIGATGSKVYHLPGGSFYNRTKAEACFNTEVEAQTAGFRKSKS